MAASTTGYNVLKYFVLFGALQCISGQDTTRYNDIDTLFEKGGPTDKVDFPFESPIKPPFNITFFGSSYPEIYISKDGLISFERGVEYKEGLIWEEGDFKLAFDKPFIAPYYYDGYESVKVEDNVGGVYRRIIERPEAEKPENVIDFRLLQYLDEYIPTTVINPPEDFKSEFVLIVTWFGVTTSACKDPRNLNPNIDSSHCQTATFQTALIADSKNTFVINNYKSIEFEYKDSYQAGFNGGNRRGWFNVIPCQEACSQNLARSRINELPDVKGSDKKGRFILRVGQETIIRGGCLPDKLVAGTLEVYPIEVGMFGGEVLHVSGKCRTKSEKIYCKFQPVDNTGLSLTTPGQMTTEMKGYCYVPKLTWKGPTYVSWSTDSQYWEVQRTITVVLPGQVTFSVKPPQSMIDEWTSRDAQAITIVWDPNDFSESSGAKLNVKLFGYREQTNPSRVTYETLQDIGAVDNSLGRFTFNVDTYRCKTNCREFEQGMLEVKLTSELHAQAKNRVAVTYGPIPLGWYVDKQLTEDMGSDWSDQLCHQWHTEDSRNETWLKHLLPCPCNVDQALADFGRFQADPGCDVRHGSACHYHKGALHCVRSIQPTPEGAGNQCCYITDGTLRYSQLSYQGSTPDRGHVWGSRPYGTNDRVPSLSHWKHDVVSFYYCCLWNEYRLCDKYMEQRPTADCRNYYPPGIAILRGDPHITTFDGQTYHFGGRGDFHLVNVPGVNVQGRFEAPLSDPRPNLAPSPGGKIKGTSRLSRVAIGTDLPHVPRVFVWPAPPRTTHARGLDIFVDKERMFFFKPSAMTQEFSGGLTIINNAYSADVNNHHNNFTILLPNNVGVIVSNVNGLLHTTVSLPPEMKDSSKGMGLMGNYDGSSLNDYMSPSGTSASGSNQNIYNLFAKQWAVDRSDRLFNDDIEVNSNYEPWFDYSDIPDCPNGPQESQIISQCRDNTECRWDYKATCSDIIATGTKDADARVSNLRGSSWKVENCGLPEIGLMAVLNNYNFSVGKEVKVTGCDHGKTFQGEETYLCVSERLDIAKEHNRDDYGHKVLNTTDNMEYIIHWIPRPSTRCSVTADGEKTNLGLILGVVFGVLAFLIVIIIVVAVFFWKKRKSGSSEKSQGRKGNTRDPASAEAMLANVAERSPVYRPSQDTVRIEGRGRHEPRHGDSPRNEGRGRHEPRHGDSPRNEGRGRYESRHDDYQDQRSRGSDV